MFWTIVVDGKTRYVSFWKWLAYMNQKKLERIEKKLDELLSKCSDKCSDDASDNCTKRTD